MDHKAIINISYIAASLLFIYGLKKLSSPATARKGNFISAIGMLIAVVVTLLSKKIISYEWIIVGIASGSLIGAFVARLVSMSQMPQMVALFNGFGGIASLLVGWAIYHFSPGSDAVTTVSIFLSVLIGGVTFTGSLIAWGKLSEKISGKPFLYRGQQAIKLFMFLLIIAAGIVFSLNPAGSYGVFLAVIGLSLIFGVLSVISIGGADMPVVISLLNSYSGLAACAAGFVIKNNVLIVSGALVGASGIILTNIMCKAMNRSLFNVLFSGFGASAGKKGDAEQGEVKPIGINDAYLILEAANSVVFVPGYGMAVAQAQHAVRELGEMLEDNGCDVQYAIHPVAGRMPGHMNVLLAEANVSYDQLVEPKDVNPLMETVDVAIVIGANDVVNPAARDDESSPIYGMPIIEVDRAKTVFILKRSMAAGFAGVANPLFFNENTRMLFGDAKVSVSGIVAEFKDK
ncbi:MAG: NAD(P)(+) transhydrogenase (Re/Si-specific) subunit beta [Spirochaetes bacterium]|nr:NAD(P)(+) transhydrogenase (Re/Si-specific) subunit beta [Spirochaetota bacterium]